MFVNAKVILLGLSLGAAGVLASGYEPVMQEPQLSIRSVAQEAPIEYEAAPAEQVAIIRERSSKKKGCGCGKCGKCGKARHAKKQRESYEEYYDSEGLNDDIINAPSYNMNGPLIQSAEPVFGAQSVSAPAYTIQSAPIGGLAEEEYVETRPSYRGTSKRCGSCGGYAKLSRPSRGKRCCSCGGGHHYKRREYVEVPIVERPIVARPVVEERVVEKPFIEKRTVKRPVVQKRIVQRPVEVDSVVEEDFEESRVVERPVVEKRVVNRYEPAQLESYEPVQLQPLSVQSYQAASQPIQPMGARSFQAAPLQQEQFQPFAAAAAPQQQEQFQPFAAAAAAAPEQQMQSRSQIPIQQSQYMMF